MVTSARHAAPGVRRRLPPALAGVLLALLILAGAGGMVAAQRRDAVQVVLTSESTAVSPLASSAATPLVSSAAGVVVHVTGAVRNPGVYRLEEGSRVDDALRAAGGLSDGAAEWSINRAAPLTDGAQVYVPQQDEAGQLPAAADASPGRINLNTAGVEELDELPGIGPALAQRIVDYREAHGPFGSLEELLEVSGIGQSKLDGLKEAATL